MHFDARNRVIKERSSSSSRQTRADIPHRKHRACGAADDFSLLQQTDMKPRRKESRKTGVTGLQKQRSVCLSKFFGIRKRSSGFESGVPESNPSACVGGLARTKARQNCGEKPSQVTSYEAASVQSAVVRSERSMNTIHIQEQILRLSE